jgi:hypothetical protein
MYLEEAGCEFVGWINTAVGIVQYLVFILARQRIFGCYRMSRKSRN